ncbi:glycosyltransferase family 2 protein [Aequorivita sp. SDUM287046]|uniref:Glycosyltransferase family 2 protein n=1 Tax=Aequorivita aurantiaca TaxID=3053356 RepID=A0ABT8DQE9_9FLAO|nr:glycosyltransferase family 2 protein [Aequorivita aurantiaca]MDN3725287.1 glycosyltransferase family 2 protein [Aequorivita aurantiaca]
MPENLITIIIPTYNRAHLIGETLDSVLAQTYQNWECIVVDDGSTDNTEKIMINYMDKDSRFHYYHRPKDKVKGANVCRNYGFAKSKGDFLIFLDSDDLLESTCLENRFNNENIKKNQDSVFIYLMGLFRYGSKTDQIFNKKFNNEKEYIENFLKVNPPWTITSIFWPRSLFLNKGFFDETYSRLQDVEIHTRLLLEGVKINLVEDVDCWYRILDNPKEYLSEEKRPMLIESHIQYIEKFYNYEDSELLNKIEINTCLKFTFLKVLKKYVLKKNVIYFKEINNLNNSLKILNFKKMKIIEILNFYHKLGFFNRYGYNKIRNFVFNK